MKDENFINLTQGQKGKKNEQHSDAREIDFGKNTGKNAVGVGSDSLEIAFVRTIAEDDANRREYPLAVQ